MFELAALDKKVEAEDKVVLVGAGMVVQVDIVVFVAQRMDQLDYMELKL
jgi:hypothetical protein